MSLKVNLNKELEKKFRELAMKKYGYSRGSLKKAAHHAIELWTRESIKEGTERQIDGKKFVEEFTRAPKKLKRIDTRKIKEILEEEYDLP